MERNKEKEESGHQLSSPKAHMKSHVYRVFKILIGWTVEVISILGGTSSLGICPVAEKVCLQALIVSLFN